MKKKIFISLGIILATAVAVLAILMNIPRVKDNSIKNRLNATKLSGNFSSEIKDYAIEDSDDVLAFFDITGDTSGMTFTITAGSTIDMDGKAISKMNEFSGTLDGNNITITNLSFAEREDDSYAFIETLKSGAVIKNLDFDSISTRAKHNAYSTDGDNGYVHFIRTIESGAMLYKSTFKNINFGCGTVDDKVVSYGYDDASLVGVNNGLISHCDILSNGKEYAFSDIAANYFYGLKHAAAFAGTATSGSYIERCAAYGSYMGGLEYVGGIAADINGSYLTSNLLSNCYSFTLSDNQYIEGLYASVESACYIETYINFVGGIVGRSLNSTVVNNIFYNINNGSLSNDDDNRRPSVSSVCGNTRIGGMIGFSSQSTIDYNCFHGTVELLYMTGVRSAYNPSDPMTGAQDNSVKNCNYISKVCDEANGNYFIDVGNQTNLVRTYVHDKIYSLQPTGYGSYSALDYTTGEGPRIKVYSTIGAPENATSSETITPQQYKIYVAHYDNSYGIEFQFDETSNQAFTLDASSLTGKSYYDDLASRGDDLFKTVEIKNYGYALVNVYKRVTKKDNTFILEYSATDDEMNNSYVAYYDAAAANYDYYSETYDPYEAVEGGYYLICDSAETSQLTHIAGETYVFKNMEIECKSFDSDNNDLNDNTSHIFYDGERIRICSRMWVDGNNVIDYATNNSLAYHREAGYTSLSYKYTRYDSDTESFALEDFTSFTEQSDSLVESLAHDGLKIQYLFSQNSIQLSGNVQFDDRKTASDLEFSFIDENNTEISSDNLTYSFEGTVFNLDISPDSTLDLSKIYLRLSYKLDDESGTANVATLKSILDYCGDDYALITYIITVLQVDYQLDESLSGASLSKTSETIVYSYKMVGSANPEDFLYSKITVEDEKLKETIYPYGYPFNPLNNYNLAEDDTLLFSYIGLSVRSYLFDRDNNTFYLSDESTLHNYLDSLHCNPTINISLADRYYKIYEYWNDDLVVKNDQKNYTSISDDYLNYIFYEEPSGLYEHNNCFTVEDRTTIPQLYDKKFLYLYKDPDSSHKFMITDIKYYTYYDPSNLANSVEYTGDIEELSQDIYCVYTLAIAKSEDTNYKYIYYDEEFSVSFGGTTYDPDQYDFVFTTSYETYRDEDVVSDIAWNRSNTSFDCFIPNEKNVYMWIVVYEDESKEVIVNTFFAQTLSLIHMNGLTNLSYVTLQIQTEDENTYNFSMDYPCNASLSGDLNKDSAYVKYILSGLEYMITFESDQGHEIESTSGDAVIVNNVLEFAASGDLDVSIIDKLTSYHIYYYWTDGVNLGIEFSNEEGTIYVPSLSSETLNEHWESYDEELWQSFYMQFTMEDSLYFILEEGSLVEAVEGSTSFNAFLINRRVYKTYNPETQTGVLYGTTPSASDCQDIIIVFDIAANATDNVSLFRRYTEYSVPNTITYGETTYNYNDGYTLEVSSRKFEYLPSTAITHSEVSSGIITYTFYSNEEVFLFAVIEDDTLTNESPAVPILENISEDFTIYRWYFSYSYGSLEEDVHATLTKRDSNQESMGCSMNAYMYFLAGWSIYVYLNDYENTGKTGTVFMLSNYANQTSLTVTDIQENNTITVSITYNEYHIYYSWKTAGTINLDTDITSDEINITWITGNYSWANAHGLNYTVENLDRELTYILGLNQFVDFKKDGLTEYDRALIKEVKYYKDADKTIEFGYKPSTPFVGDIYCVLDFAFTGDNGYGTKEVGDIKLNGEIVNDFSFRFSDLEYYCEDTNNGSCAYENGEIHYYIVGDGFIWLWINGEQITALDNTSDTISCDLYSITVRDGDDDGYGINYDIEIGSGSDPFMTEGDSGDSKVYYVNRGDNVSIRFQYSGEDGYEYHVKDDSFTLEKNCCVLNNVLEAHDLVVDFDYVKSHYTAYFYIDKQDILDDPNFEVGGLYDGVELNSSESVEALFESKFPNYPNITKDGYRLVKYYIFNPEGEDILVTDDTLMPAYPVCVYGEWVEAGRASFEISFYDATHHKTAFEDSLINEDNIRLYYRSIDSEGRVLMTQIDANSSSLDTMQYKVTVEQVMDGGYFYRYQFYFYPEDGDSGTLLLYIRLPNCLDYTYFDTLNDIGSGQEYSLQWMEITTDNQDLGDTDSHITILGNGWYYMDEVVTFTLDIEEGYYAYFSNSSFARVLNIYNSQTIRVASIMDLYEETNSLAINLTLAKKTYYIYYYIDGVLQHTDSYFAGDAVTIWTPGDDILEGQRMTDWNDTLDTMPASNVTLYANIIAGITNTYTVNFSGTVTEGMFFIADNKEEITSRTIITEAKVLSDNQIELTYKENQGFLWMVDPTTSIVRYINVDLDSVTEIDLIEYTTNSSIVHLSISNLGYHPKNSLVAFEVIAEPGYTFDTSESCLSNLIVVSGKDSDYEINITERKLEYSVYYYIKDTMVHQDRYYFDDEITIWTYDPSSYSGEFNFLAWSDISMNRMPASDVLVYGQEAKEYTLVTYPNVSNLHEGETLSKAVFTDGLIKIGTEVIYGTYTFKNQNMVVSKADSMRTLFDCVFQPDDMSLAPFEFQMTLVVCNPKYNEPLEDIYLISRTSNSISVHINSKYEFCLENGSYQEGRELVLTNLREDTTYTITYRYKADDTYCASDAYTFSVRTLSYDEMLYINSQNAGLSLIDSAISYFDNPTVQRYLSYFQVRLSISYETSDMSGLEASTYVEFLRDVIDILQEIEDARIPISHLNADRILNYANKCLDEISNLAFENNVSTKNLARYKTYILNVLNVSDSIVTTFGVTMSDLINYNSKTSLMSLNTLPKLSIDDQSTFVIKKVDELFKYDYSNYSHVNLKEYKDEYIGNTVTLMANINKSVHHTDSAMVTQNISKAVNAVQVLSYEDYTFNREEYDKIFFKAAEVAVVAHMQVIVLNNLDDLYLLKTASIHDFAKLVILKNVYLGLVDEYSDFDTFYAEYRKMIEEGNDMTYDDCILAFDEKLDARLVTPVNSGLTSTEVVMIFVFGSAIFALVCVIVARHFIKRRGQYARARD